MTTHYIPETTLYFEYICYNTFEVVFQIHFKKYFDFLHTGANSSMHSNWSSADLAQSNQSWGW